MPNPRRITPRMLEKAKRKMTGDTALAISSKFQGVKRLEPEKRPNPKLKAVLEKYAPLKLAGDSQIAEATRTQRAFGLNAFVDRQAIENSVKANSNPKAREYFRKKGESEVYYYLRNRHAPRGLTKARIHAIEDRARNIARAAEKKRQAQERLRKIAERN